MIEVQYKTECYIVNGVVFDTREEAEEQRLRLLRQNDARKIQQWILAHRHDYTSSDELADMMNRFGFYHDGADR